MISIMVKLIGDIMGYFWFEDCWIVDRYGVHLRSLRVG